MGLITVGENDKLKIGTYFKKENIFLGTIIHDAESTKAYIKANEHELRMGLMEIYESSEDPIEYMLKAVDDGFRYEEPTLLYKDDAGFTRFTDENIEVYVGDGSDGKSVIKNIVSAWEYFIEEQLLEVPHTWGNFTSFAIAFTDENPLIKYDADYNNE